MNADQPGVLTAFPMGKKFTTTSGGKSVTMYVVRKTWEKGAKVPEAHNPIVGVVEVDVATTKVLNVCSKEAPMSMESMGQSVNFNAASLTGIANPA